MAHKGQNKSPALACFNHELTKLEDALPKGANCEDPPQIYVEHFSFEELHYTMKRNNGRIIRLYDELSLFYEQFDRYKSGNSDRKTILSLINGGCWRRNFRSTTSTMRSTCFNLTGFVQPGTVIRLCNTNDDDGLMDRQLFACPGEVHYDYDEYRQLTLSTPGLSKVFEEIENSRLLQNVHTLSADAHTEFIAIHDSLNECIREQNAHDQDRKSILSKAHGQVAHVAAVHYAIDQALHHLELKRRGEDVPEWSYEIPKDTLLQAKVLMDYFINQKFAMLRQGYANGGPTELEKYDWHRLRRILELQSVAVTPSMISQAHIQIRAADGRYHRDDAIKLMEDLRSLNLVELDLRGGRGRPTTVLRKRRIDDSQGMLTSKP